MPTDVRDLADIRIRIPMAPGFRSLNIAVSTGIAVAEALCCGAPIIVPDTGGAADFAHADVGEIYATGNADDAAKAVLRLLARDQETLHRAAAARADATIGNADAHFDRLFALYERLVAEKAKTT